MKLNNKKGFTLIELLVVITIIGILAVGGVAVYTTQISKARDTTRINDVEAFNGALVQYFANESSYPKAVATVQTNTSSDSSAPGVAEFLRNPIGDNRNALQECSSASGSNAVCGYIYTVGKDSISGVPMGGYEIATAFESDKNRIDNADNAKDSGDDADRYEVSNGNQNGYNPVITVTTGAVTAASTDVDSTINLKKN